MDKIITIGDKTFRTSNIKEYGISSKERHFQRIYLYEPIQERNIAKAFIKTLKGDKYHPTDCFVDVEAVFIPEYIDFCKVAGSEYINMCLAVDEKYFDRYCNVYSDDDKFATFADCERLPEKYNGKPIIYDSKLKQKRNSDDIKLIKWKYLYITTYQNDNYRFYQSSKGKYLMEGYDIEQLKKELDRAFSESSKTKEDPYKEIEKLKKLLDMGAITEEEFEEKKKEQLSKI